jgi:tetratricopeptide (TPR) repeat protein
VQDVPSEAKNLYKKSVSQLEKPKDEKIGLENLKKTLEIFPNYYDALNRIGYEHVKRGQYIESLPYLIKAIEVNERSFSSFYLLGLSAYNLKQIKQSVLAFQGATTINPQSVNAYLKYGMVLRIDGQFKEAEQALLRANTLSKNTGIPEVHWQLALLYDKIGRYNDAATELETYLKLNPNVENIQQIKELITVMRTKAKQKV